ncbi:unnamed protein product [Pseudo-nitzschia multistriata]|uniref:WW domain-containing protein n=1 Tax=Pseudo-nitzschia multistriata TaxID=183589 RepID=A0A448ZGN0_9STRA|nr:unnamed protein product [Pseudo-nitzschia multistriata]
MTKNRSIRSFVTFRSTLTAIVFVWCCAHSEAFQATPNQKPALSSLAPAATAATTLAVLLTLGTPLEPAFAASKESPTAGRITINQIPPKTVRIEARDLPVVGKLVSGTYARVDESSVAGPPSVIVSSPRDTIGAIKKATTGGHVEFDVGGSVGLRTHLDVDIAAEKSGVASVRVASDLIPQLPFRNAASSLYGQPGRKESQWNIVTNMGSGESYYFNTKTGVTQYEQPSKF